MSRTPAGDERHEKSKLKRRDWERAVCVDAVDPDRRWTYHYPMTEPVEVLGGMAAVRDCETCGERFTVAARR